MAFVAIFIAAAMFLRSKYVDRDESAITRLQHDPLPLMACAYKRIGFVIVLMLLSAGFAFLFSALIISAWPSRPAALFVLAPCAVLATVIFLRAIRTFLKDTSISPWGEPVICMSLDGITRKALWSIPWTDVNAISYVKTGHYRSTTPYMLLTVKDRQRFSKSSWIDSASVATETTGKDYLLVELGSMSFPLWKFQLLAKRYWCVARDKTFTPTPYGQPFSGEVSIDKDAQQGAPAGRAASGAALS